MMTPLLILLLSLLPQFTDQVDVHLVTVDVTVTDADGHQILGLTPEDFTVLEDGKAVPINSLEYYSTLRPVTANPDLQRSPIPGRRFAVVIQKRLDGSDFSTLKDIQRDLKAFLRRTVRPGDEVALFIFKSRLICLRDFTTDHKALVKAMGQSFLENEGTPLPDWFTDREELDRQIFIDGLMSLTKNLGNLGGRKDLVLLSYGFGKVTLSSIANPVGDYSRTRQFQDLLEWMNDANVTAYVIDLHRSRKNSMEGMLTEVASRTGGRYFGIFNQVLNPLKTIEESASGYYLITYYAETGKDHGYRKIEVRINNPEFRIRFREGYRY